MMQRREILSGVPRSPVAPQTWPSPTDDRDAPEPDEDDDLVVERPGIDGDGDRRYTDL